MRCVQHMWPLAVLAVLAGPVQAQGTTPSSDVAGESDELEALRLAELEMFGQGQPLVTAAAPRVVIGLAPPVITSDGPTTRAPTAVGQDHLQWLQGLTLPDIPVRWDARVVRYLEFYRSTPRGRNIITTWLRRRARYEGIVRAKLSELGLPRDLLYVAMIESGFDPTVRSPAGAVGMWQFVRSTGAEYGLTINHWVDERQDPARSTDAGARYLRDLHRRFGSWELALAAFNMGYGALLRAIRKFNTNDYWALTRIEAGLPFETTFYVAKVMACAIVGRNPERFGLDSIEPLAEVRSDTVQVAGGSRLSRIARAADTTVEALQELNPGLLRTRIEPGVPSYAVHIPEGRATAFNRLWSRMQRSGPAHAPYVVRFGDSLSGVAHRYRTSAAALRRLNELDRGAALRRGTTILVPAVQPRAEPGAERPVASVPREFRYEGKRRLFYRVVAGDTASEIAAFFRASLDDLRLWNNLDTDAVLQQGLVLQLFVEPDLDLTQAVVFSDNDVRVLVVGTDAFFDYHEAQQGRVRFRYRIQSGDTLTSIGERFELSVGSLARINRFARDTPLQVGQEIIVYTARERAPAAALRAADRRQREHDASAGSAGSSTAGRAE